MGTKAPYQTKQMKQILAYLQTIEGTHVTVPQMSAPISKSRESMSEQRQFIVILRRW